MAEGLYGCALARSVHKRAGDQIKIMIAIADEQLLIPAIPDHFIDGVLEFLFQGRKFPGPGTALVALLGKQIYLRILPGLVNERGELRV